ICCGLLFLRRYLRRPELEGQLVDRPGEAKWQCIAVVHPGAGIHTDVEGFVDGHHQWDRVLDRLLGQFLAIHGEHAGAALGGTEAVVFEVEHKRVLARLERAPKEVLADSSTYPVFPAESLQIEEIVNEDRLALLQEEAVAAEVATQRHDHSLR